MIAAPAMYDDATSSCFFVDLYLTLVIIELSHCAGVLNEVCLFLLRSNKKYILKFMMFCSVHPTHYVMYLLLIIVSKGLCF